MRKILTAAIVCLLGSLVAFAAPPPKVVYVRCGKLIFDAEKPPISPAVVVITEGKVTAVGKDIADAMRQTAKNTGMKLVVALNYGGRAELADAFNAMLDHVRTNGLSAFRADEQTISDHLYTAGLPDPDLLIRTSGEMRVSNFLLWQIAYAEIYVTEALWPDFSRVRLLEALVDFQKRERRYGGLGALRPEHDARSRRG